VTADESVRELVKFRLFKMPCCGQMLCWVNPRTPNYCPECGKFVYGELVGLPQHTLMKREAWLKLSPEKGE